MQPTTPTTKKEKRREKKKKKKQRKGKVVGKAVKKKKKKNKRNTKKSTVIDEGDDARFLFGTCPTACSRREPTCTYGVHRRGPMKAGNTG